MNLLLLLALGLGTWLFFKNTSGAVQRLNVQPSGFSLDIGQASVTNTPGHVNLKILNDTNTTLQVDGISGKIFEGDPKNNGLLLASILSNTPIKINPIAQTEVSIPILLDNFNAATFLVNYAQGVVVNGLNFDGFFKIGNTQIPVTLNILPKNLGSAK